MLDTISRKIYLRIKVIDMACGLSVEMAWKKAGDIHPGDFVAEADGSYFRVSSAKQASSEEISITLENVNKYMTGPGVILVPATSNVRVLVFGAAS